jgi:hypothetical protein
VREFALKAKKKRAASVCNHDSVGIFVTFLFPIPPTQTAWLVLRERISLPWGLFFTGAGIFTAKEIEAFKTIV